MAINPLFGDDERSKLSAFCQSLEEEDGAITIFLLLHDFYVIASTFTSFPAVL